MLKRLFLISALFWTGVILFFSLERASEIPVIDFENIDKIIHAFFHFVFTFLWFLFFKKKFKSSDTTKLLLYSFLFSLVFGVAIELMQLYLTTSRSAELFDVVSNLFGASLAVCLILVINKYNRLFDKI